MPAAAAGCGGSLGMQAAGQPGRTPVARIAIVGVGLIGGSLGLAWRAKGLAGEVVGVDISPEVLERAVQLGAIDRGTTDLAEGVRDAGVVVLAAPVGAIMDLAGRLAGSLRPGTLVTDVGSTKGDIVRRMSEVLPPGVTFIGGHPMAGSEAQGVEAADPYLFQNAVYVLTPPPGADDALALLSGLLESIGAKVAVMDPDRHDRMVAAVSHLPQLVAVALVNAVTAAESDDAGVLSLAAGGFRDTTRITSSPPGIWLDILASNRGPVLEMLSRFRRALDTLEAAVRSGDRATIAREFEQARRTRERLPRRPKGLLPAYFELVVTVEDRPGIIGGLATLLGDRGVNIEDIEILRLREGEGGTIRLGFATEEECRRAVEILDAAGYKVRRR